jgi:hypothetical protein
MNHKSNTKRPFLHGRAATALTLLLGALLVTSSMNCVAIVADEVVPTHDESVAAWVPGAAGGGNGQATCDGSGPGDDTAALPAQRQT